MARVFAARDLKHQRDVAVKVLRVEGAHDGVVERFLREVSIAAQLNHPHILPLFDSGEVDGAPYFVMPLAAGRSLRAVLEEQGQIPLPVALSIARQVAAALEHAHAHGIVHRDIKPENILIEGRDARVTDFGVAAALNANESERITMAGVVVGTPRYMSPEQALGDPSLDGRADIYALGVTLFEMLTGETPYPPVFSPAAWRPGPVPSVRVRCPDAPESLDAAIAAAIAREPEHRTRSARAFIESLEGHGLGTRTPSGGSPAFVPPRSATALVAAAATLVVAGLLWSMSPRAAPSGSAARRWILVAEFESDTADRGHATAMRELAITELAQSSVFSIVPSEQVLTARRNAGLDDSIPMSGAVARELAVRSAVRVVVEGAVRRVDSDRWLLTLRAVDADDGGLLIAEGGEASSATLVRELGGLVRRVRAGLGERPAALESTRPLQDVSTASFPAFQRYQDALMRARAADYDGGIHLLHQAVALDSGFASAWALLANLYVSVQRTDSVAWAFERAAALPERLSDADRDRLAGDMAFYLESDPQAAVRAYDAFLMRRPESLGGHNNRGLFLAALGRHADALAGFREALRVDPLLVGPRHIQLLNIASELVVLGHVDSAEVVARPLEGSHRQYSRLLQLNARDRWDSLAVEARAVLGLPSPPRFSAFPAVLHEAGALVALGRGDEAVQRLDAQLGTARGSDLRWYLHARLLLDAARGVPPRWTMPPALRQGGGGAECLLRGLYAAQRGDIDRARQERRCLDALAPRARRLLGYGPEYLDAWVAMAGGDAEAALRSIEAAAAAGEHHPFSVDRVSSISLRLLQARALEALGRLEEARAAMEHARSAIGLPPSHYPLRGLVARAALRAAPAVATTTSGQSNSFGSER